MNRMAPRQLFWLVLVSFATHASAQSSGPVFPNPGKTKMSKEQQRALGMQTAEQVFQQMPVLPDSSPESQYIRALGQKLVATIPAEYSWPFEFHVIPQEEINAFALPGGQMFVNVGTIKAAKTEAELAGVMGHEMSHVYMQHSAKQASKAQTTSMLAGIAGALLGSSKLGSELGGLAGQLGQMGIQMGAEGLMMKYSRNDETQADSVGAVILHKAGYNPQGMADFFQTMGAAGGKAPPVFFSSHPASGNRQEAIQKQIASWPAVSYSGDSVHFAKLRQHASQRKTYSAEEIQRNAESGQWAAMNQRNGASLRSTGASSFPTRSEAEAVSSPSTIPLDSVLPSANMVLAELGPMKIARPENWTVKLPEEKGQFVTIGPQVAMTSRGVAYGVLLNGAAAPSGQRLTIDEMTTLLIQKIQESNDLEQLGQPEPVAVGDVEGRLTLLKSPSPLPDANGELQAERDWLVTVPRQDGSMIFMIFVAPEADFARFQPTYEAMVKSARFR